MASRKPSTNRTPPNPKGKPRVTSSATRSSRQKASKAKVSGANPSSRANRQKVSTAKMTESGKGVTKGSAKVTQGKGGAPKAPGLIGTRNPISAETKARMAKAAPKPQFKVKDVGPRSPIAPKGPPMKTGVKGPAAATLKSVGSQALKGAAKAGIKAAVRVAPAVAALNAGKVADGTLGKGKPVRSAPRPSGKPNAKEKATSASFGASFQKARASGAKSFMWKGKKYTTKRKDGK